MSNAFFIVESAPPWANSEAYLRVSIEIA
jgi:hypothetical protein